MELKGRSEGTGVNPKVSLLTTYCDNIIPEMEAEDLRLSEVVSKKVVAAKQEYRAVSQ